MTQTMRMEIAGRRIPVQAEQSQGYWTLTVVGKSATVSKHDRSFAKAAEALKTDIEKRIAAHRRG